MAIEKTIEIKVDYKDAVKNLKEVNSTIDEQRAILVLLESEYIKAKKALDDYNASGKINLAQEKQLKQAVKERKDALTDQRLGLKKLAVEQREANKSVQEANKGQKEQSNIIKAIDKLTGGYATKIIKLKKGFISGFGAVKNFIKGLSGIKKALIATGVGALVVGLATVIAYWDEITALFDNGSKALQKQADEQRNNVQLSDDQLALLEQQEKILKLQGGSTEEIVAEKRKVLLLQQEQNTALLETLKLQLELEKSQVRELSFFEKAQIATLESLGQYEAAAKIRAKGMMASEEELDKIKELEEEIQQTKLKSGQIDIALATIDANKKKNREKDAKDRKDKDDKELKEIERQNKEKLRLEKEYQDRLKNLKDRIREAEAVTEDEQRALKLEKLKEENKQLMAEALAFGLLSEDLIKSTREREKALEEEFKLEDQEKKIVELELDKEFDNLTFEEKREVLQTQRQLVQDDTTLSDEQKLKLKKQFDDAEIKLDDAVKDAKLENAQAISGAIGGLQQLAGESTTAGKALGIAQATIDTYIGANKAIAQGGIAGTAAAIGIIASGLANVKNIVSTKVPSTRGGGPSTSVSSPAQAPQPPQFNIVGATETSQLAEAVAGQEQQPVQAYVVSNDVTTAQSLENNIVEGATL